MSFSKDKITTMTDEEFSGYCRAINELRHENYKLNRRIDKAIAYMNNTYEINDLKELFEHYNNVEAILEGWDNE